MTFEKKIRLVLGRSEEGDDLVGSCGDGGNVDAGGSGGTMQDKRSRTRARSASILPYVSMIASDPIIVLSLANAAPFGSRGGSRREADQELLVLIGGGVVNVI